MSAYKTVSGGAQPIRFGSDAIKGRPRNENNRADSREPRGCSILLCVSSVSLASRIKVADVVANDSADYAYGKQQTVNHNRVIPSWKKTMS